MGFSGKHALVTGGTSGIGLAVVEALASEGASVVATGLAQKEVDGFPPLGTDVRAVQLDVTNDRQVRTVVDGLVSLDVLVTCAGTMVRGGGENSPDQFSQVVDVNLVGTMRICAACLSRLSARGGSVVTVASLFSIFGAPHAPAYSASKGGVVQLTKSLAVAWADRGIRVNAVLPGWIETSLTRPVQDDVKRSKAIMARTPLGRWGRPHEVADAVLFLASPKAGFITGAVLVVDGGYSVM